MEWDKEDSQLVVKDPEYSFCLEPYSEELTVQMLPLWVKHHEETAYYKDIALDPNFAIYQQSAKARALRIFTLRRGHDDFLLGYQVFFVSPHPHSKQSVQAVQDILFIDKDARLGLLGYRFIKWCSDMLLGEGVDAVFQHISAQHDFGAILRRIGYNHVDLVYGRRAA